MKSRTKPALRVVPTAEVQISLPVQGVLQDVKHAFYGLCIHAGREVLTQMLEADRVALCGVKNVADPHRRAVRTGPHQPTAPRSAGSGSPASLAAAGDEAAGTGGRTSPIDECLPASRVDFRCSSR